MEKQPLSFGKTLLASALGVLIVSAIGFIISLVFFLTLVFAVSRLGEEKPTPVEKGTFLTLDLGDIAGDRGEGSLLSLFNDGGDIGLIDAVDAIRNAAKDPNVSGIMLTDPSTATISWASMEELRSALADFQGCGKPVVAYSDGYSQKGYYLASTADLVCLHPAGLMEFSGIGAEVMYYKDLLDKLGVEMQLIRPESCSYKSAGEAYTMNRMSKENREQIRTYISSIWKNTLDDVATSRHMDIQQLNKIADNLEGYLATDALQSGLVDTLCFEADVRNHLKSHYQGTKVLAMSKYIKNCHIKAKKQKGDAIALIYAEGDVLDGSAVGMATAVYGDDIVKALRKATVDKDVKAIVLRVNSPGGSATASESMTHAVMEARKQKPVIVSMGDLAASAGYEMSCMADVIVAQPTTVTGSIGVFATIPNAGKALKNKLGITSDTVLTNRNAASLSLMHPLSPAALKLLNRNVEDFYKVFVSRVAEGRHMTYDAVHTIARGRVWTGIDAMELGLVDTLGGIDLAFSIAAEKANLKNYRVKVFPEEKDLWEQLNVLFGEQEDEDMNLLAKMRLAWKYFTGAKMTRPTVLSHVERDLFYISEASGLLARLPFIVLE
jgi:protease-4